MKNWFADISMTRKLTIGFGAVLLLTIALAISGWLSLSGVIHRSELMERIAALNEALDELRVAASNTCWTTATRSQPRR